MKKIVVSCWLLVVGALAANAAEFTINVDEGQTFAYAIDDGDLISTGDEGPAKVTFAANRNATYTFYEVAKNGTATLIESVAVTDAEGETVSETADANVAVDTRAEKEIDASAREVKVDLTYSGNGWGEQDAGTSATVTFKKDGGGEQTLLDATEGAGVVQWAVERGGKYVFTHKSGEAEETATFVVNGLFTVRVPKSIEHLTCAVYFGETPVVGDEEGQFVLYEIRGLGGTIVFTPTDDYLIESGEVLALPVGDKTLATEDLPVLIAPGAEGNPWKIGEGGTDVVQAYVKDGVLVIAGSGAMADFASAAVVPWAAFVGDVTEVTIAEGVTKVGKNSLARFDDKVMANGTPLSFYDMMAGARGSAEPAEPSGVIGGAEFEQVKIVGGKAYLAVSVCTNGDVTAATEGWQKAAIEGAQVEEDGTVTLTVPATAEKGFMILKSKGAEK